MSNILNQLAYTGTDFSCSNAYDHAFGGSAGGSGAGRHTVCWTITSTNMGTFLYTSSCHCVRSFLLLVEDCVEMEKFLLFFLQLDVCAANRN